jgi:competence ComEA-like helix-hairpin-helix protein
MSRKPVHDYLYFTRKERRGSLVLLLIVLLFCLFPFGYSLIFNGRITTPNEFDEQVAALKTKQVTADKTKFTQKKYDDNHGNYDTSSSAQYSSVYTKPASFYFDPNTLPAEGWKRLGLREKTIATIQNYISKGGKFRRPEDIKKIWGLFPDQAERLIPYVRIEDPGQGITFKLRKETGLVPSHMYKKELSPVAINESDTSAWIALPGIGSTLSQRIVNFRNKLGGFHSVEQVGETFGLGDSTFQKIKPLLRLSGEIRKLNLNSATMDELKAHPYIRYQLANAILQYRSQHGNYSSVEEIKQIMIVTDELFKKVSPYLTVDQIIRPINTNN